MTSEQTNKPGGSGDARTERTIQFSPTLSRERGPRRAGTCTDARLSMSLQTSTMLCIHGRPTEGEITMDRSRLLVGGSIKHSGLLRPTRFCDRSEPDTSRHGNARPRPSEKVPSREAEGGNNG